MKYKVSVIVPVYNAESYLDRSLSSICNQTIRDLQIILVDDGSTDNSLSICEKYAETDSRIQIIKKANGGVSSARNAGLNVASGEYIGFVDPDDWIEKDMYENMYNQVKKLESEISICNYVEDYGDTKKLFSLNFDKEVLNNKELEELVANMLAPPTLNSNESSIMGSVWRALIRNDLIKKRKLRFNEEIHLMEDIVFLLEAISFCNTVCINKGSFYHYCNKIDSAVRKYRGDFWETNLKVLNILTQLLNKRFDSPVISKRLEYRYVNMIINSIANELKKENKKTIREKIEIIANICRDKKVKLIIKNIDTSGYKLRKKVILRSIQEEKVSALFLYYYTINKIVANV